MSLQAQDSNYVLGRSRRRRHRPVLATDQSINLSINSQSVSQKPSYRWSVPTVPLSLSDSQRLISHTERYNSILCSNSAHVGDDCRKNLAFKTAAKPLQTLTWLLLTADRNSSSPYPIVPSPTPYDVRFSYNTMSCVTDDGHTDRRHIVPKALPITVGRKLK